MSIAEKGFGELKGRFHFLQRARCGMNEFNDYFRIIARIHNLIKRGPNWVTENLIEDWNNQYWEVAITIEEGLPEIEEPPQFITIPHNKLGLERLNEWVEILNRSQEEAEEGEEEAEEEAVNVETEAEQEAEEGAVNVETEAEEEEDEEQQAEYEHQMIEERTITNQEDSSDTDEDNQTPSQHVDSILREKTQKGEVSYLVRYCGQSVTITKWILEKDFYGDTSLEALARWKSRKILLTPSSSRPKRAIKKNPTIYNNKFLTQ